MPILLTDLLTAVPDDMHKRVDRTRKRIGATIREALRQETGLVLNRQDNSPPDEKHETVSVPVTLVGGLPARLRDFAFDDALLTVLTVSPYRRDLERARAGLQGVKPLFGKLGSQEAGRALLNERDEPVGVAARLVSDLLRLLEAADPVKQLLAVEADVLGAYIYPAAKKCDGRPEGRIELYWLVLGLVARMTGVEVEPLAAVVLVHETAHAYTHLGSDIDGERWSNQAFAESEHALIEGLAQYYTDMVSRRLDHQVPETHATYQAMLLRQPEAYRTHLPWVKEFRPEEVRSAMLAVRRSGVGRVKQFDAALADSRRRLRGA